MYCKNNQYNKDSIKYYYSSGIVGQDSDGASRWYLGHMLPSSSKTLQGLCIEVARPGINNKNALGIYLDASGNREIIVSDSKPWSSAIGLGPFRSVTWTATKSAANAVQLTNKITGLSPGVYLCVVTLPIATSDNFLMTFAGSPNIENNTYFTGKTNQTCIKLLPIYNNNTSLWIASAQSFECSFSNLERGGLRVFKLRDNPHID